MSSSTLFIGMIFAVVVATAAGQTIDPAVLAKAKAGNPSAQVAAGEQFAKLAAATQDPEDASDVWKQSAAWYLKAAEQGDLSGEVHTAECYRDGRGVVRDMKQAAEWYRKAADEGDVGAQGTLAMLYTTGQGVPQSDVDAYFWFDIAAATPSPYQQRYIVNRQNVGTRITADDLETIRRREKSWRSAHPRGHQ